MKAAKRGQTPGIENIVIEQVAEPGEPGPGEVRVRIHANSLNFHDYAVAAGMMPSEAGRLLLSDGAGVVESVGAGVTTLKAGDHVVSCFFPDWEDGPCPVTGFARTPGDGIDGYATPWVVRPASFFTLAPQGWSHAQSATLTTAGLTAWRALVVNGGLKAGDDVLILGTGGVSLFALQLAQMMGARVFATSSSDEKLARLKTMGVHAGVNYRQHQDWGKQIWELTGGRGVDHVIEIGGPGTLANSIDAVAIGGHIALIGVFTGLAGEVPTAQLMAKQAALRGITVGSRRHQQEMIRALDANRVTPLIDKSFALEELPDAFNYEYSGQHMGKIVIEQ